MNFQKSLRILEKRIFQALIFLLPTQLAFHFWPSWSHIYGIRVDYLSPTIYLTDIVLLLLFLTLFVGRKVFSFNKISKITLSFIFLLIVFAVANIVVSANYCVAINKWLKIAEFVLFAFYVAYKKDFDFHKWIKLPLIYSLIFFGFIALAQLYFQRTLGGIFQIFGERRFNVSTPAIALYSILGKSGLRAYSTFSHPNSLAGYFAVCFFLLASSFVNRSLTVLIKIAGFVSVLTILISFSYGSWVAIFFGILVLVLFKKKKVFNVVAKFTFWLLIFASLLMLFVSRDFQNTHSVYQEKITKRAELAKASGEMFSEKPILGVGLNNYIVELPNLSLPPSVTWWLQPVHNIFLLILAETGLIGLLVSVIFLYKVFTNLLFKQQYCLAVAFLVVLITGFVDHYWLTLQQNQLLLSVIFGLSFRKNIS